MVLILIMVVTQVFMYTPVTNVQAADEYDALRQKWYEALTGGPYVNMSDFDINSKVMAISTIAQNNWDSMNKSGLRTHLWSSYSFTYPKNSFDITGSYYMLRSMALGYSTIGSPLYGNVSLKADILSAMDWMYNNKYNENSIRAADDNWWDWEIGSPAAVNEITILLYNSLSASQITNYMNALNRWCPNSMTQNKTGANRVWYCKCVALRGIIKKDAVAIASARDGLSPVFLNVTNGDGFHEDGSFLQHEYCAYNGGYGVTMISDIPSVIYLLKGSTWNVMDPNVKNIYRWIYDGFEPLLYKGAIMDMTRGRNIARYTSTDHSTGTSVISAILGCIDSATASDAAYFKSLVKEMISTDTYFNFYSSASLTAIIKAKAIMKDIAISARGNLLKYKQYAGMDRSVIHRPGYAFGVSMHSNRVENYERTNRENMKGWNTGNGMTYLYNNDLGQFSENFWPTVNSYRLPGTTVEQNTSQDYQKLSDKSWVGGADMEGTYGITGMWLAPYGQTLSAKKSWFMFDNEIAALGAEISASDNKVIETVVENRKLTIYGNNSFIVNGTAKSTSLGWSETMSGVNWAYLQGNVSGADMGYYFPGSAELKGLRQSRTGTWAEINYYSNYNITTPYTNNYLTLWFDHGNNPASDSYSYVLLPGMSSTQVQSYSSEPKVSILSNTGDLQAVQHNGLNIVGANFWVNGVQSVEANGKSDYLTCDKKASVMVKDSLTEIQVSVSDPTQSDTGTIQVTLNEAAADIISKDPQVQVLQFSPKVILSVNVNEGYGKTYRIKLSREGVLHEAETLTRTYYTGDTFSVNNDINFKVLNDPDSGEGITRAGT